MRSMRSPPSRTPVPTHWLPPRPPAQAFVVSQVGFALGTRIGEATREGAERLAGAVLIVIAGALLVGRILGHVV